jgi:hypothetical protein
MTMALAGELSDRRHGRLVRHLERCGDCRREREAYTALDRALGSLPLEATLPARLEQVTLRRARLADGAEALEGRPPWLGFALPALAATAVLVVAARLSFQEAETMPGTSAPPPAVTTAPAHLAERGSMPAPAPRTASRQRRRAAGAVPAEPPPELAARPDLFVNLPLLRNFDKLQHYEAIQTIAVDGEHSSG